MRKVQIVINLPPPSVARAVRKIIRRGNRTVLFPPQGVRFGNFLYYWLQANARQRRGEDFFVLWTPDMEPWLQQLPLIADRLVLRPESVRIPDRRDGSSYQRFGVDFSREELHEFIREYMVGTPLLGTPTATPRLVTVNVRRGDYYSNPEVRGLYGFDIRGYLEVALPRALVGGGEIGTLRVVSDDVRWCELKLDDLLRRHAPSVEYLPPTDSAAANFRTVATSQRIIGTNSTFTYWAGYVCNVLFGEDSHVIMPDFHGRHKNGGRAYQHDPDWDIVKEIPGGWDA